MRSGPSPIWWWGTTVAHPCCSPLGQHSYFWMEWCWAGEASRGTGCRHQTLLHCHHVVSLRGTRSRMQAVDILLREQQAQKQSLPFLHMDGFAPDTWQWTSGWWPQHEPPGVSLKYIFKGSCLMFTPKQDPLHSGGLIPRTKCKIWCWKFNTIFKTEKETKCAMIYVFLNFSMPWNGPRNTWLF